MALDFISAIGNAISGVTGLIKPSIDEKYSQLYDDQHRERLKRLQEIMALPDGDDRATKLCGLIVELLLLSGNPAGDLSGGRINIPISHFLSICAALSDDIRQQEKLAKLTFKVN